jgi:stage II sporulation protein D
MGKNSTQYGLSKKSLIFLLLIFLASCARAPKPGLKYKRPLLLSVCLSCEAKNARITADDIFYVRMGTRFLRFEPKSICRITKHRIEIGDQNIERGGQTLIFSKDGILRFDGKSYRGRLLIKGERVINIVNVEDYLKGVVPCEMGNTHFEALKAQAVAARSYAISKLNQYEDYDLLPSEGDQVYGGIGSENSLATKAVAETYGLVLIHKGKVIDARYSSTCGGRTANSADTWGVSYPYLKSVRDKFCVISPYYSWEKVVNKNALFENIRKYLSNIFDEDVKSIVSIRILEKDKSGKVKTMEVKTKNGTYKVSGDNIRKMLDVKSRSFKLKISENNVVIEGRGFGHGVGMCQWGAIGMAMEGWDFQKILKHFYKGVHLKKIY